MPAWLLSRLRTVTKHSDARRVPGYILELTKGLEPLTC